MADIHLLESLLFVATEPTPVAELARALDCSAEQIEALLAALAADYRGRGLRIQRHGDTAYLVTAPEAAATIHRFLGLQTSTARLSNAALETLAIIAYKQPLTKAGLDAVRGVDCGGALRTLLQRGLVEEVGRQATAGRPLLYGTTQEFLQQFGIDSVSQLPPLDLTTSQAAH